MDSLDAPSRLDTAHPGHFHVHNNDLGNEMACHLVGRVTIYRFAYYRDQRHRPGAYEVVQANKTLDKRPKRHPSVELHIIPLLVHRVYSKEDSANERSWPAV